MEYIRPSYADRSEGYYTKKKNEAPGPIPMDPERDYAKFPAKNIENGGI